MTQETKPADIELVLGKTQADLDTQAAADAGAGKMSMRFHTPSYLREMRARYQSPELTASKAAEEADREWTIARVVHTHSIRPELARWLVTTPDLKVDVDGDAARITVPGEVAAQLDPPGISPEESEAYYQSKLTPFKAAQKKERGA